jgi:hypothetical protein
MDNSTVVGDNVSEFSVPYKDSRPATPLSQQPTLPRMPAGYFNRAESPARTASPLGRSDDYFARAPSRGYTADMTPGYTPGYNPGYTPDDAYELSTINSIAMSRQRSYESRDLTDSTALLPHAEQSRDPSAEAPPSQRGGYM